MEFNVLRTTGNYDGIDDLIGKYQYNEGATSGISSGIQPFSQITTDKLGDLIKRYGGDIPEYIPKVVPTESDSPTPTVSQTKPTLTQEEFDKLYSWELYNGADEILSAIKDEEMSQAFAEEFNRLYADRDYDGLIAFFDRYKKMEAVHGFSRKN